MADDRTPSRRSTAQGGKQQPSSRRSADRTSQNSSSRRSDVIRCERCGEDYSVTYKRCPFCDERPSRGGVTGRRVADHGGPVNPIQVITLVISLVVIIAALFIVFTYIGPLLFGGSDPGGSSQIDSSQGGSSADQSQPGSQSDPGSVSTDPGGSSEPGGDVSQPVDPAGAVTGITLNKSDFTLWYNETFQMEASITPAGTGAQVTWSSSDPAVLPIDGDGIVKNLNGGTSTVNVTVTASCGSQAATCIVRCRPALNESDEPDEPDPQPSGELAPNTQAVVVNAGTGLNVRSGPGTSYDRVASISNGNRVTVLEAAADGWYLIDYGNGQTGYVLGNYLAAD